MIRKYELVACLPTPLARHPQLQPWKAPACTDRVMPVSYCTPMLCYIGAFITLQRASTREFFFSALLTKKPNKQMWRWSESICYSCGVNVSEERPDYILQIWCGIRMRFMGTGSGLEKDKILSCFSLKQETNPRVSDGTGSTRARCAAGPACPSFLSRCTEVRCTRISLLIRTRKTAIEASQRAHRTSKATLNPKSYFPMVLLMKTNKV